MKGMSNVVRFSAAREDRLIDSIDNKHIYCRYDHRGERRGFSVSETMNREEASDGKTCKGRRKLLRPKV